MTKIVGTLLLFLLPTSLLATHIVGAELYYECTDTVNHTYDITLKMYRDCENGQAAFDDPIVLFVFDGATDTLINTINVPKPLFTPEIVPANWDSCVGGIYNICVEEGVYRTTRTLLPRVGGYNLAWARCCRNQAITNLATPLGEGATFLAHIPGSAKAQCNSMPIFNQLPPIFLCANKPFYFDHSATDPDGDSLVYRLVDPYTGLDLLGSGAGNPTQNPGAPPPVVDLANRMGPPPYATVTFATGYDWFDPFGSGNFVLNSQTGFITVTPNQTGIFVFAISVFEYRNGVLISENRRDFQIHILNCLPQGDPPKITHDLSGLNHNGDTVFVSAEEPFCFPVAVTDTNLLDTLTAYTVSAAFGNGTFAQPYATFNWTGINPIQGQVCWTPACVYVNQTIPLILGAYDIGDCPNIADVFDTIYVHIDLPPNQAPVVTTDLTGLNTIGDTIIINAEDNLCFDFAVTDINQRDTLVAFPASPVFNGADPPSFNWSGINPLQGQICWTPSCAFAGQTIPLTIGGQDASSCNRTAFNYRTVYVKIVVPPNAGPAITTNLSGLNVNGDSIFVYATDSLCFNFRISDPNFADSLQAYPISAIFGSADPPSFNWLGTNPVQGQICWQPGCQYVGQVIPLIYGGNDDAICNTARNVQDTVFVVVQLPPNRPPSGQHSFGGIPRTRGDTIIVDANEDFCYRIDFSDLDVGDSLTITPLSPIFTSGAPLPTVVTVGTNPTVVQVCWKPDCNYQGQLIPMVVSAADNGECNNNFTIYDTVWVKVSAPGTLPPIIRTFLNNTIHVADTIYIDVDDSACYDFMVIDKTFDNGLKATFEFQDLNGRQLGYGTYSTYYRNDTIFGRVCFKPPCVTGGNTYKNVINGIDNASCPPFSQAEKVIYIKVNTDFKADAGADIGYCEGTGGGQLSVTPLGGRGPYTYLWSCDNPGNCGLSNPYSQSTLANPSGTTTYSVQITDADGCSSEIDSITVRVKAKPIVDAGPDVYLCEGEAGIFMNPRILNPDKARPPYQYNWSPGDGLVDPTVPNTYANPDSTTIYTLVVTSGNGCSSFTTTLDTLSTMVINRVGTPRADAGPDIDICFGDSAQLVGSAQGSHPPFRYEWTPAIGIDRPNHHAPKTSPGQTFTYFLVAWSRGCPSPADSVRVIVHTLPTAEPGSRKDICLGDSIQLPGIAGGDLASDYTYQWTPATGLSNSQSAQPMASPGNTTDYVLEATSIYGCGTVPYDVNVRVKTTPIADAGPDDVICRGDTIQLNASYTFGGEPAGTTTVFYEWKKADGIKDFYISDPWVNPNFSTTYTVTTSYEGCMTTDSVVIDVFNAIDNRTITADTNHICSGDSIQLFAYGGTGNARYSWAPANAVSDPTIPNPWIKPDQSGTYTVFIEEGKCSAYDSINIKVTSRPAPDYLHSTLGGCALLEVGFQAIDPDAVSYIWDFGDGSPIQNGQSPVHVFQNEGTYRVTYIAVGAAGCESMDTSTVVRVGAAVSAAFEAEPGTGVQLYLPEAEVRFTDLSVGAQSWLWDFGDGNGSHAQHPVHLYEQPGSYQVILVATDEYGCSDTATMSPFLIETPDLFIPNVFTPNEDGINDVFGIEYSGNAPFNLQVFNRWGQKVYESNSALEPWDGRGSRGQLLSAGVYYYVLKIGEKEFKGNVTVLL
jgi:gliding motility-associated-like protein